MTIRNPKRRLFVLSTFVLLGACSTLSREAGYPGGNVGYLADRYALFAKGHDQQVNRYLVTLALVAPLIAETVDNPSEAKLSSERITNLYRNISRLEDAATRCSLPKIKKGDKITEVDFEQLCNEEEAKHKDGSALNFEVLSFDVNRSLNRALKQAFDNLNIRSNLSRLVALEPTEILKTIVKARHLVPVLIRYLSTFRDVTVVFGLSVAESCKGTNRVEACKKVDASFGKLLVRTRNSNSEIARDERPLREVFDAGEEALNDGLNWQISKSQRIALLYHVNRACKKLDALAGIEFDNFKGCRTELSGATSSSPKQTNSTGGSDEAQTAVSAIIDGTPKK